MGEITKQEEIFCEQSVQGETHEKEPTLSGTRTGTPVTASVPGLTNTRTRFGSSGGLTDLGGAFSDGDGGGQGRVAGVGGAKRVLQSHLPAAAPLVRTDY